MYKWISVKEKLPEENDCFLVLNPRYSNPYNIFYFDRVKKIFYYDEVEKGITHWMPLPELPENYWNEVWEEYIKEIEEKNDE